MISAVPHSDCDNARRIHFGGIWTSIEVPSICIWLCIGWLLEYFTELWQLRQPAPLLEFPGEQGMLTNMYAQVREEEQVIAFMCSQQDVSKSRRKKRKQVDDGTAIV